MRLTIEAGADIVARVRGADTESVVLVVAASSDPLVEAMARAAIGPLAIEQAPACRVNAIFAGGTAAVEDIDNAVQFLEQARSTTGQILDLA